MQALLETGFDGSHAKEKAEEMLSYFRLPENLWDIYPNTFSGGERLRLNLAHTMVKKPRLMLLDEPTASLDNKSKVLVKDMLLKLKQEDTSMIGIFHDLEFMDGLCGIAIRQYRTKSIWRLCTPSACKFPLRACFVSSRTHLACIFSEIFRENTRKSTKDFLRFPLHLSKNLTTQSAYVRYETDSHISQKCS